MARSRTSLRKQLELLRHFDAPDAARKKLSVLKALGRSRLARAGDVERLHDTLCFLRAYPDDREVLAAVEELLDAFPRRSDLRHHREQLAGSGIAGTRTFYSYYWFTVCWLARRWPEHVFVDWEALDETSKLEDFLHLLVLYGETPALDDLDLDIDEFIAHMTSPDETDAVFLARRFEALSSDSFLKEALFESFDIPIGIDPGPDTPSRTRLKLEGRRLSFQRAPLARSSASLRDVTLTSPHADRQLSPRRADALIELVQQLMVAYNRDLLVFYVANRRDVRIMSFEDGVEIALLCAIPERRLLLESLYGFVVLKNGVPIGYGSLSGLFASTSVAYNIFSTYRGAESATIFGYVMSAARTLFGADSFVLDPFQLGHDNEEGLSSGAWWFYYKLGFRPHDADVRRVLRRELARMKKRPHHRSSESTLNELTAAPMFFYLGKPRQDVLGRVSLGNVGLGVVDMLARRFGSNREEAERVCQREAAALLGVRSLRGFSRAERLFWRRWAPLILTLPGVKRWPEADKAALVEIVRAKGGRHESDFVTRFDAHSRLRGALLELV